MALGPILIFDKSTLQSLNPDEALWLDNFFSTNITPLFFIETLADLEKEVRSGRTPEQVVGNLAYKTPDMGSRPNVHHSTLLEGELTCKAKVAMDGRPLISGGEPIMLGDKTGFIFKHTPEQEALDRWQRGEFLDIERQTAKLWRRRLSLVDYEEIYRSFQLWFLQKKKPKSLTEAKALADSIIHESDQANMLNFGLSLIGVPQNSQGLVTESWQASGKPAICESFPYFRYILSVDLFFYLAIAADLISRQRPSNKIDLAYLYYLPFCMIFASNDHLHKKIVPLFMRSNQSFVDGSVLKTDLARLDERYSALPEAIKNLGIFEFASYPPKDGSFLVAELWDKHFPLWRQHETESKSRDRTADSKVIEEITRFEKEGVPLNPGTNITSDGVDSLLIKRSVYTSKGKWNRFSPEVK